jgi:hypothetical protein
MVALSWELELVQLRTLSQLSQVDHVLHLCLPQLPLARGTGERPAETLLPP